MGATVTGDVRVATRRGVKGSPSSSTPNSPESKVPACRPSLGQKEQRNVSEALVDVQELAQAIKSAVQETAPTQQVHISQYRGRTPWNPTGKRPHERPKLRGEFMQNGQRMIADRLSEKEIGLLNQIKPGRYIGRKVEVIERQSNGEVAVEIRYNNATADQRSELKNEFRNLAELCERIIAEHKASAK